MKAEGVGIVQHREEKAWRREISLMYIIIFVNGLDDNSAILQMTLNCDEWLNMIPEKVR